MSEDKSLTPDQEELIRSRIDEAELEYGKIWGIIETVLDDDNARLPFIPLFCRRKPVDEEEVYLDTQSELVYKAHQEEYCLTTCKGAGSDCMASCLEFASNCYDIGDDIYLSLQKPYAYSQFQISQDEA